MLLIRTAVLRAVDTAASRMRSFQKDERGAIIVLTLFLFLAMVLLTGVAIDVVRTEHARTKLQGTLDRAILAAAANDNTLDPKEAVMSYFQKAGLGAYMSLDRIEVEDDEEYAGEERSINFRSVTATTFANVPTMFLNRVGINHLPAPAAGRADEGMSPIEIVLVLDVSGSMVQNVDMQVGQTDANGNPINDANGNQVFTTATRLASLQSAARRFVRTVYRRPENTNRVAVAIVPYAWNVNFHAARDLYGKPAGAPDTGCLIFDEADFRTEQILPGANYRRDTYSDVFSYYSANMTATDTQDWDGDNNKTESRTLAPALPVLSSYNWTCPRPSYTSGATTVQTGQMVLPYTNDQTALINHINAMTGGGSTSIEIGMKWGVHMIDPSYRTVNAEMINQGRTPDTFFRVPNDYGYAGTKKYIVLMSDGENMPSYSLNPQFSEGLSPIFEGIRDGSKVYSFLDSSRSSNQYFWARNNTWNAAADRNSGPAVRLTWDQVWDRLTVSWTAYHLYAKRTNPSAIATEYNRIYNTMIGGYAKEIANRGNSTTMITRLNSSDKDARLNEVCATVRDNPLVTVFTIAFRPDAVNVSSATDLATAPAGDQALAKCASTFVHHYPASSGQALQTAFDSIAAQILDLRLTQ